MLKKQEFIEVPNLPDSNCFACGPINDQGLKMKFYANDSLVYCNIALPPHLAGWRTLAHGGVLSTLLDETMSWGAIVLLRKYIFTKSITVNYHKPVSVMEMLRVESEVKDIINDREAIITGRIFNNAGDLCTSANAVFSLMTKEYVKKLGLVDDKEIDFYWEMFDSFDKQTGRCL